MPDTADIQAKADLRNYLQRQALIAAQPFNTIGELADERRQAQMREQSADLASQRRLNEAQVEGDAALKRRLAEKQEDERLRLIENNNANGFVTPADATYDQAGKIKIGGMQERARSTLEGLEARRSWYADRTTESRNAALEAVKDVRGTPEQQQRALQATLNDPTASKFLPSHELAYLRESAREFGEPITALVISGELVPARTGR